MLKTDDYRLCQDCQDQLTKVMEGFERTKEEENAYKRMQEGCEQLRR